MNNDDPSVQPHVTRAGTIGRVDRRSFIKLALGASAAVSPPLAPAWALAEQPLERRGPGKRVVILGAGLAGLVAAYQLKRSGHEVVLLEAQLRAGGRVRTLREPLTNGLHAEEGAGRIPSTHRATLSWIRQFGLPLEPFYPRSLAEVILLRGRRIKRPAGRDIDMSAVPLKLSPAERRVGLSHLDNHYYGTIMKRIGEAIKCRWPPEIAQLGEISFASFLEGLGASPDAIRYLALGFEQDSALDMIRDSASHHAPNLFKIQGGNDRLPGAFAARLADQIHYGCGVVSIQRDDHKVRVWYKQAGGREHVDADEVICTIPFSVLRNIEVLPPWPDDKRRAIDRLSYGSVVRTTYQTRRRYWEQEGLNGFGLSDTSFEVWSPTFGKPGKRGILQAYVYEDFARRLSAMGDEEREQVCVAEMEKVHPGLAEHLEGVISKCWDNDIWQRGAFTLYRPGEQSLYPVVCRNEGHIRFAGEHASPWPGWMQGALVSGTRAAREIDGWRDTNTCKDSPA